MTVEQMQRGNNDQRHANSIFLHSIFFLIYSNTMTPLEIDWCWANVEALQTTRIHSSELWISKAHCIKFTILNIVKYNKKSFYSSREKIVYILFWATYITFLFSMLRYVIDAFYNWIKLHCLIIYFILRLKNDPGSRIIKLGDRGK